MIREERSDDHAAIRRVNERAFGRPDEGRLVDVLRASGGVLLSLVAVLNDRFVARYRDEFAATLTPVTRSE